ncbi:bombesin receptor-activated protein C6orf89 homolog isoform X1 [Etheostoma cragini]|uniref:bombesin receptor-activated protein C6orf89 homolog isoform X1 n=1 Tax=Etheostoma cragini TaxID=417921 RepID=UPI00155F170B|nr:bombesin receptor-activated protein C6orf89 homolog isoform X1 [Etheostoma cragini]XP_034724174.1 bombesin receptor-activated protein C6orf89 homolog isoform X1 [Etheostoma cragini]XP_034724175.1 bombesin receptor-activated protein C6orf89 homolog isoform X1 [Etheostoma cragini]
MSEPCIYDKLSESIDILRQSGYRYGMSEREIERFIKQVLETNEPRREPPQFPILRATIKFVVAVGFLLVVVLAFTYPQSPPQLGLVNLGCYNWSSPLSHVRLLSLPIAKKYNLQGFHEWWSAGSLRQNLVNCSGCAEISSVMEVPESLRGTVNLRRGPQLVLLKGGESLSVQRQQLEELYLAHSGSMSILLEEDDGLHNHNLGLPQGPANFTMLWRFSSGTREKVLRWLFPKAELCPLLDSAGTILQRCLVTHSTNSQSKGVGVFGWLVVGEGLPTVRVLPVQRCQKHCSSFNLWLTPGDMGNTRFKSTNTLAGQNDNFRQNRQTLVWCPHHKKLYLSHCFNCTSKSLKGLHAASVLLIPKIKQWNEAAEAARSAEHAVDGCSL